MVCEDTLKVQNLPKELSDLEKEDFLKHFGAQQVKIIASSQKQKCVAYAKFESKSVAKNVLSRLHQVTVLNSRLCVEYAEHDIGQGKPKCKIVPNQDERRVEFFNNFVSKINAFNNSVNFYQPPPAHLKYSYPKANRATISNIAHALATIPKFYTQVLHLMNKMNLPPPFVIEDFNQLPPRHQNLQVHKPPPPASMSKTPQSSSESELESDPESSDQSRLIIPAKRVLPQKKQVKRPKFIKPNPQPAVSSNKIPDKPEDVFDRVNVNVQRKIEMKVSSESLEHRMESSEDIVKNTFAISDTGSKNEGAEDQEKDSSKVISDEELAGNQIPRKDLGVLPVFKNYHPGAPTNRLYIKNIAKSVDAENLGYIYNRYKLETGDANKPSVFNIRLMKEGRMKGQAFITFDNVDLAQKALNETNGFILKEKPLVVVFAKSAVIKK